MSPYTELEFLIAQFANVHTEYRDGKFYVVELLDDGDEVPVEITSESVEEFVAVVREQLNTLTTDAT